MQKGKVLLSATAVKRVLSRMAHEIAERNESGSDVALVGIQRGGINLANRLVEILTKVWGHPVAMGTLDATMHRDDLENRALTVHPTSLPFDLNNKIVILVDDVIQTGRTTRAALEALHHFGRPKAVQLAVMIDRGHRQLPIKADFIGKSVLISHDEHVHVNVTDGESPDQVTLEKP